ncbi:MAG: riboflavin biosynthesis protein RibF [Pontiellaceae bacterium]|jgi:riboflavin kinase/FMN adenylyltransferase|nr:riboflavin biosynthesis protein RibF [Pontiellaceae bacterium]
MLLIKQISELPPSSRPVILAMGCFDGVHIGHQKVISTAVEQAHACGGDAWIYTFNPHPARILSPDKAPPLISAPACRLRQFAALGVSGVIEIPFDTSFARIGPEEFLFNLLEGLPTLKGIVCGIDWSFGYKAIGAFQSLETFCKKHGLTATAVHPVLFHDRRVSSTHVRQAVREGNIPLANQLLGRPFCLFGRVINGRGIGCRLGFPTANIAPENELIPAPGVYAAWTKVQESGVRGQESEVNHLPLATGHSTLLPSAVFIGKRTTFKDHEPVIETHLLDFDGDLYGQPIEIGLMKKIRDTVSFPSEEALIAQIKKDIAQIRTVLESAPE